MSTLTQEGTSRGTGQYGGRRCLKVKRVFLCAAETTVGKVLSTSISTSESSDIFSTIWGIILDAERGKKKIIYLIELAYVLLMHLCRPVLLKKNNNKETKNKHIVPSCFKQMRSFITAPKFRQTLHKSCTEKLENLPRTVVTLKETWYCISF